MSREACSAEPDSVRSDHDAFPDERGRSCCFHPYQRYRRHVADDVDDRAGSCTSDRNIDAVDGKQEIHRREIERDEQCGRSKQRKDAGCRAALERVQPVDERRSDDHQ